MTEKLYAGLCIGGPKDGQWAEYDTIAFITHTLALDLPRRYGPNDELPDPFGPHPGLNRFEYQFVRAGSKGFWVPATETNPVDFTVERLTAAYLKERKK